MCVPQEVHVWGVGLNGELGTGLLQCLRSPRALDLSSMLGDSGDYVERLFAGPTHLVMVCRSGRVMYTGDGDAGIATHGLVLDPEEARAVEPDNVVAELIKNPATVVKEVLAEAEPVPRGIPTPQDAPSTPWRSCEEVQADILKQLQGALGDVSAEEMQAKLIPHVTPLEQEMAFHTTTPTWMPFPWRTHRVRHYTAGAAHTGVFVEPRTAADELPAGLVDKLADWRHDASTDSVTAGGGSARSATASAEDIAWLFRCCRHRRVREADELISGGIPLESQDESGNTPLIVAAQNNARPIVEALLGAGANPNAQNVRELNDGCASARIRLAHTYTPPLAHSPTASGQT